MRFATLLLLLGALVGPATARAGGAFADLAVGGSHVWFVGEAGVYEVAARTGRIEAAPQLVGAPYPLSVALAGGAAWVASVENGYVYGTLSRIDERTHRVRVVWRHASSSVQYVAPGAGGVWALIGRRSGNEVARFAFDGRLERTWSVPAAGRMAADASGCWISMEGRLLHIDNAGRLHFVLRAPLGDVAAASGGAVWLPRETSVLRIDERTGNVRTLVTGRLALGGFQHDLAVGAGSLWVLRHSGRTRTIVERRDLHTGRLTGRVHVPGIADALVVRSDAVWVATGAGSAIFRLDPRTLHRALLRRFI